VAEAVFEGERVGARTGEQLPVFSFQLSAKASAHAAPAASEVGNLTHLTFFYGFGELRFNGFKTPASAEGIGIYGRQ
jgi:hypothetical protein